MSAPNDMSGPKLDRHAHADRGVDGRYRGSPLCDGCNRPVGTAYYTDDEVCGATDGPGFFVCERKSCAKKLADLNADQRREVFARNREAR